MITNKQSRKDAVWKLFQKKRAAIETSEDWFDLYKYISKGRAKQKGFEWTITKEDLIFNNVCPVLGIRMIPCHPDKNLRPSIDRIDSSKGYIPGNVRIISFRANRLKNNSTYEEAKLIVENWNKL